MAARSSGAGDGIFSTPTRPGRSARTFHSHCDVVHCANTAAPFGLPGTVHTPGVLAKVINVAKSFLPWILGCADKRYTRSPAVSSKFSEIPSYPRARPNLAVHMPKLPRLTCVYRAYQAAQQESQRRGSKAAKTALATSLCSAVVLKGRQPTSRIAGQYPARQNIN